VKKLENKKDSFLDEELELVKTRIMLNKLIELNLSLYTGILNYAKRKGIPVTLDSRILQLTEEIEKTDIVTFSQPSKLSHSSRRNVTDFDNSQEGNRTMVSKIYIVERGKALTKQLEVK